MTNYLRKTAQDLQESGLMSVSERGKKAELWAKDVQVTDTPSSFGLVSRATEHAVFIQMMDTRIRGLMSIFVIAMFGVSALAGWSVSFFSMVASSLYLEGSGYTIFAIIFIIWGGALTVIPVISGIRIIRIDIFGPKDIPLVLNHKTRKVYKFALEVPQFPSSDGFRELIRTLGVLPKYWLANLKPWPLVLVEYDWDCMGAEYQQYTSLSGNVVTTLHHFNLHVTDKPGSNKVIGLVTPMAAMLVGSRERAASLWEFIRRFMEEGGPALCPGDQPAPPHPKNLLQSAQLVAPYYWVPMAAYLGWYIRQLWLHGYNLGGASWQQLTTDFFAFISFLYVHTIICNWLAHTFGRDVELPAELMVDAGAVLDLKQLAHDAAAKPA